MMSDEEPTEAGKALLKAIKPARGEMDGSGKFSPNLYRWMAKIARNRGAEYIASYQVFRGGSDMCPGARDTLYIGRLADDGWFYGTRLWGVLCTGARKETFAYQPSHIRRLGLTPCPNFWSAYIRIGRCAIDKDHSHYWQSDDARWEVSNKGKTRSCVWCGAHKQRLQVRTKTIKTITRKWVKA